MPILPKPGDISAAVKVGSKEANGAFGRFLVQYAVHSAEGGNSGAAHVVLSPLVAELIR